MAIDERRTEDISSISGDSLEENEIRLRISELMEFEAQSRAILRDWIPETRLNGGAFAHVFRMRNRETRQRAALKFIPIPFKRDECVADPEFFKGEFDEQKREVELLAQFRGYPYIMQVIGEPEFLAASIQKNGQKVIRYAVLFLMPLLNAKDIWGPQIKDSIPDRLRLCVQISTALIAFNEKKIRHRDIKPENILMDEHGDFCLTDLGQAKKGNQTTTFRLRGTEGYIAPEVYKAWENEEVFDHRADIYSLGIVMYELFNWGQKPFLEKNGTLSQNSIRAYHSIQGKGRTSPPASECAIQLRYSGKVKLPPPEEADSELASIILKACAYEAKNRYKNAEALLNALEAYRERHPECAERGTLRVHPVQAVPPVPDQGGKKERKPVGVVLAILAFAGICVGVWILAPDSEHDKRGLSTSVPAIKLTETPTAEPTAMPTIEPTATPTIEPTATPTIEPTTTPTAEPTATPTIEPTATPTAEPTATPTIEPTPTPLTIQALQQDYTLGEAVQASMKRGQKLAVYSGPDYSYIRGAKGKASVSTNDWVDCYGLWGDWYLIEYEINDKRNRRGYINRYEVHAGDSLNSTPIPNAEIRAVLTQNVSVTDDPTLSGSELISLKEGKEVTIHFFEGAWACISFRSNSGLVQGYVPASSLALDAQ